MADVITRQLLQGEAGDPSAAIWHRSEEIAQSLYGASYSAWELAIFMNDATCAASDGNDPVIERLAPDQIEDYFIGRGVRYLMNARRYQEEYKNA